MKRRNMLKKIGWLAVLILGFTGYSVSKAREMPVEDAHGFVSDEQNSANIEIHGVDSETEEFDDMAYELLSPPLPEMWCLVYDAPKGGSYNYVTLLKTRGSTYLDSISIGRDYLRFKIDPKVLSKKSVQFGNKNVLLYELTHIFRNGLGGKTPLLVLMPSNLEEYLNCLRCENDFKIICGNKIKIKITSAATMGAFWNDGNKNNGNEKETRNTYVYYPASSTFPLYCELETKAPSDTGEIVSEVAGIWNISDDDSNLKVLTEADVSLGCVLDYLILHGVVKEARLLDMMRYGISIGVRDKDSARIERFLDLPLSTPKNLIHLPARYLANDVGDLTGKELVLSMGLNYMIEDLQNKLHISSDAPADLSIGWEIDEDMVVYLLVEGPDISRKVSLGSILNEKKWRSI